MAELDAVRLRMRALIALSGIVLADARTGDLMDLGAEPPFALLTLIRHRY